MTDQLSTTSLERVTHFVRTTPDALCLISSDERVTYRELWRRAARIAAAIPPAPGGETVLGIVLPRGVELVVAQLGAWLAGAAFLPLDVSLPVPRIVRALRSAGAGRVVTTGDLRVALADAGAAVEPLEAFPDGLPEPPSHPEASRLAYVISTSGTTGTPKSVAVEHGSLANLIAWYLPHFGVTSEDRVLFATGPGFDVSILDIWGPLSAGATVVVAPAEVTRDVQLLLAYLDEQAVTRCMLPTPLAEALLGLSGRPRRLRSLQVIGDVMRVWPDPAYPAEVVNAYGPAETTVLVTVTGDLRRYPRDSLPPIGRPVANAEIRIVGADGRVISAAGRAGELWIGGPVVARGYLNAVTDRDASAFGAAPWGEPGRWYRSGDVGAWRAGGELHFLGRTDRQVKVRGHRVEPAEIEHTMLTCDGVQQAVVVPQGAGDDVRIIGYAVGRCDADELYRHLEAHLPAAMLPARLHVVPEIPLTVNGKLDRAALGAMVAAERATGGQARDDAERAAVAIWESVLKTAVGREDNFFRHGGDSLSATRIIARLKELHGYSSSVRVLLNNPILHEFAALLESVDEAPAAPNEMMPGQMTPGEMTPADVAPLSDAQRSFWDFLQGEGKGTGLCEIRQLVHVSGVLDLPALHRAVDSVSARHEALRSTVGDPPDGSGEPVQVIHAPEPVPVPVHDLTALGAGAFARARHRAEHEGARPFDLSREKPFRVELYRLGPAESLLSVVTHHMFFDGQSAAILNRDLAACYSAVSLPAAAPYRAYVAAGERLKTAARIREYRAFWNDYLDGFGYWDLPTDFRRPDASTFDADEVAFDLPAEALHAMNSFCAENRVTKFSALVGAFALAVAHTTDVEDLLIGVSASQRTSIESESIVGELTHTVPLRFDVRPHRDATSVCLDAAHDFRAVGAYSDIHYRVLLPGLRDNQGFQLRFSLNDARSSGPAEPQFAGLRTEFVPVRGREKHSNRDIRLDLWDRGTELHCVLTYRSELYRKDSMERAARSLVDHLTALDPVLHRG